MSGKHVRKRSAGGPVMKPQRRAVRHTVVVLVWECSGKQKFDWHVHVSDLLPSLPEKPLLPGRRSWSMLSVCGARNEWRTRTRAPSTKPNRNKGIGGVSSLS